MPDRVSNHSRARVIVSHSSYALPWNYFLSFIQWWKSSCGAVGTDHTLNYRSVSQQQTSLLKVLKLMSVQWCTSDETVYRFTFYIKDFFILFRVCTVTPCRCYRKKALVDFHVPTCHLEAVLCVLFCCCCCCSAALCGSLLNDNVISSEGLLWRAAERNNSGTTRLKLISDFTFFLPSHTADTDFFSWQLQHESFKGKVHGVPAISMRDTFSRN